MSYTLDLSGRRALVTGAGQGVGRGIALGLAEAGASVAVNDLDAARAAGVVAEIEGAGGTATPAVFDVTDHAAVTTGIEAVGGVDVLVNNAGNAGAEGWPAMTPFAETQPADWEAYLRVNLYGVLHCCHAALPGMIAKGEGRIITIVSDAARSGEAQMAVYAAAKAGAAGLMRSLAVEGGRHGVTVNSIALGTMRTPISEAFWAEEDNPRAKGLLQRYAIRRPGLPEDVAALTVFLASDQASWITGQTYPLNGGASFAL
jgi:3-oxoacyl-[acyl-carrier protein] reductase